MAVLQQHRPSISFRPSREPIRHVPRGGEPRSSECFDELEWIKLINDDRLAGQCVFGILTSVVLAGLLLGVVTVFLLS